MFKPCQAGTVTHSDAPLARQVSYVSSAMADCLSESKLTQADTCRPSICRWPPVAHTVASSPMAGCPGGPPKTPEQQQQEQRQQLKQLPGQAGSIPPDAHTTLLQA